VASFFAERRVPKVTIYRFWIHINLIGGHCVLYWINARPEPIKANGHGNKNRTPNPAPNGAHVTPLCPILNSGVKALSEVRRLEVHTRTNSQTFCVNARSLFVGSPARVRLPARSRTAARQQLGDIRRDPPRVCVGASPKRKGPARPWQPVPSQCLLWHLPLSYDGRGRRRSLSLAVVPTVLCAASESQRRCNH